MQTQTLPQNHRSGDKEPANKAAPGGWKHRAGWWSIGLALAALTVWALPGHVIRLNGEQMHRLSGSSGGTWQVTVQYDGNLDNTLTKSDSVTYTMPECSLSSFYPPLYFAPNVPQSLTNLNQTTTSSSNGYGTISAKVAIGLTVGQIQFMGPTAGSVSHTLHINPGRMRYLFTWQPKNNDSVADPPPSCLRYYYARTVSAQGYHSGNVTVNANASCQGLSRQSATSATVSYTDPANISGQVSVSNGSAEVDFSLDSSLYLTATGNTPDSYSGPGGQANCQVDLTVPGYQLARGSSSFDSGNHEEDASDPSFTRWLPLSFSPHVNSQPFRTQAGALTPPWGNINCFYSIALQQEPTPPNYDLNDTVSLYLPKGYGNYQALPGDFIPAYTITDANGERLSFDQGLHAYPDVHSSLSYNATTGVYTLANAGPPGALRQKGRYAYTFSGGNLTSISDDIGNQQTCSWSTADPFLTVTDSSSGRSLVFHRPSSTGYVSSVDALGPTGTVNTHTALTMDANGHMTNLNVYDASGQVLLRQDGFSYGGANGDALLSRTHGLAQSSFTYATDSNLVDPFGLGNNRIASASTGSSTDTSSSDDGGAVQGTTSFIWGPTQQGYGYWGVDARTSTFTNPRGISATSVFALASNACGTGNLQIGQTTNTLPSYAGQPANSNVLRTIYTPSMVNPQSVTIYDPLYNAGLVQNPWQAFFDSNGNVTRTQDPLLNQWQFGYNTGGTELTSVTDPTNLVWQFHYGENGYPASRLTSVLDPGNVTLFNLTYNSFGQVLTATVPSSVAASGTNEQAVLSYFANTGDLNTVADPLGDIFQINSYDALGDPLSFSVFPTTGKPQTEPTASWLTTTLNYDASQNVTNVLLCNGLSGIPTYNNGVVTQLQVKAPSALGGNVLAQQTLNYDTRGRFYKVADSLGTRAEYRYDKNSNITKIIDGRGNATLFTFGQNDEPTSMQWPDTHQRSITYDVAGRVKTTTDERNIVTNYTWDAGNRLSVLSTPNLSVQLGYDAASRLLSITDGTGQTQFTYDATRKRLQSVATTVSALPSGSNTFTVSYTYYGDGKVATMTSPLGQTSYFYNAAGELTSLTDPYSNTSSWQYDHAGRMTRQTTTTASGTTIVTNYVYGVSGLTGDPSTAPAYISQITQTINGQAYWTYNLQHSLLGQLLSQQGTGGQSGQSDSASYGFDTRGRLSSEALSYHPDSQHTYSLSASYNFDNANNLEGGTGGWSYNSSNQVTGAPAVSGLAGGSGLVYDAAGNLTSLNGSTLAYNDLNYLSSAGTATFAYDGAGRRVSKTAGGVTTYFLYDGYAPIAELNASGQVVRGYVWGPAGIIGDQVSGQARFYLFDGVGNARTLLSSTGAVLGQADYTAWGATLAQSGQSTPFGWQGQSAAYTDTETGLVKLGLRYYAPAIGRFLSRDPSGFAGGLNLYGYCSGDPVNVCDASGLDAPNEEDWVLQGLQEGVQNVVGAPQVAAKFAFHHGLRAANAGLSKRSGAPTLGSAWSDGSCEAEYVNARYRHVGAAVADGIDEMGGMIGLNIAMSAFDLGGAAGAGTTAEELASIDTPVTSGTSHAPTSSTPNSIYQQLDQAGGLMGNYYYDAQGNLFSMEHYSQDARHIIDFPELGRVNLNRVVHEHQRLSLTAPNGTVYQKWMIRVLDANGKPISRWMPPRQR